MKYEAVRMSETIGSLLQNGKMSDRSGRISEILRNRRPFGERATKTVEHLRLVSAALDEFAEFVPNMLQRDFAG
jgi:hypothetical protein